MLTCTRCTCWHGAMIVCTWEEWSSFFFRQRTVFPIRKSLNLLFQVLKTWHSRKVIKLKNLLDKMVSWQQEQYLDPGVWDQLRTKVCPEILPVPSVLPVPQSALPVTASPCLFLCHRNKRILHSSSALHLQQCTQKLVVEYFGEGSQKRQLSCQRRIRAMRTSVPRHYSARDNEHWFPDYWNVWRYRYI